MPSVFTLQGPTGQMISAPCCDLAGTTTPQLDFLTATPKKILTILKQMAVFFKQGAAENLPVLVSQSVAGKLTPVTRKWKKGKQTIGLFTVDLPFTFLGISDDTAQLWSHALKRSGMAGGLAIRAIPIEYDKPVTTVFTGGLPLGTFFPGFIGHAETQLAGVKAHIAQIEGNGGASNRRRNIAIGVGAGLVVAAATLALAITRD